MLEAFNAPQEKKSDTPKPSEDSKPSNPKPAPESEAKPKPAIKSEERPEIKDAVDTIIGKPASELIAEGSAEKKPDFGLQIVEFEASKDDPSRRTKEGYLDIVGLPANDGGGSWEIAGVNAYHPEMRAVLRAMKPSEREKAAAHYIEDYARKHTGLHNPTGLRSGTEFFVLDSAFNRGGGGAAWIVQSACRSLGFTLALDMDFGPKTRAALLVADKRHSTKIIARLRDARERYERHKGYRANLWGSLVNRWNKAEATARLWNRDFPIHTEAAKDSPPPIEAPSIITLPRESDSNLNRFYGTAKSGGGDMDWFEFPVDDMVLYSEGGTGLKDRDGNGRDEHRCHKLIIANLEAALMEIYNTLGEDQFKKEGWHIFGGCFNYRRKTSGGSLSTHSWGIAIDINPDKNGWKYYGTSFSDTAIDIMEKYGFLSAGRAWGHDYMHFQAAIPFVSKGSYYAKNGLPKHIKQA